MTDPEHAVTPHQRKAGFAVKIKSALRRIVLCLTVLLMVIFAVPACISVGLMGIVWAAAKALLRSLDG